MAPVYLGCLLVLAVVVLASLTLGSKPTTLAQVFDALGGHADPYLAAVFDARYQRTLLGVAVGAALAVAGTLMQSATGNPLADPGLLGINAGAAAAMVTCTALFGLTLGSPAAVWVALVGAGMAAVAVYVVGTAGSGSANLVRLILAGAVVTAVLTAYVQGIALSLPQTFDNYRFWVVGSLHHGASAQLFSVLPFLLLGLVMAFAVAGGMNALALGNDAATGLGVHTGLIRAGGLGAATLMSAAATAAVGPIAFIGLAVPHIVRALVGLDMRRQLIGSLLVGPVVLLAADVIGRVLLRPQELMVGVVTAFVGAPVLLLVVRKLGDRS
ncbi:FecCD family ABC transporter permease [Arthrobacter rhombi]|uniref:FecCD family ABC transporter permease n=1 Tax=Arthrobacter rhombi TaxID=71253 RepID=UPI001FE247B2|nr:iron chelate uptake ABC transporter family permease subunit [Arthrobacter rhombi]